MVDTYHVSIMYKVYGWLFVRPLVCGINEWMSECMVVLTQCRQPRASSRREHVNASSNHKLLEVALLLVKTRELDENVQFDNWMNNL